MSFWQRLVEAQKKRAASFTNDKSLSLVDMLTPRDAELTNVLKVLFKSLQMIV